MALQTLKIRIGVSTHIFLRQLDTTAIEFEEDVLFQGLVGTLQLDGSLLAL